MKNILIVILLAGVGGAIGFMATAEISRQMQNAKRAQSPAKQPATTEKEILQITLESADAGEDLSDRMRYAMFGGGGGAVLGFVAGLLIASRQDAKKKRSVAQP